MRIEELSSVVVINLVDIDNHQGEADVDDNEDKEEDEYINDHVGHGDDNRPRLSPHETSLNNSFEEFQGSFTAPSHLNIPEESHESADSPETGSNEGGLVALVRTTGPTLVLGEGQVAQDEGREEDQVVGEDVDILEGEPPPDGLLPVLRPALALLVQPVDGPGGQFVLTGSDLGPDIPQQGSEFLLWIRMVLFAFRFSINVRHQFGQFQLKCFRPVYFVPSLT